MSVIAKEDQSAVVDHHESESLLKRIGALQAV